MHGASGEKWETSENIFRSLRKIQHFDFRDFGAVFAPRPLTPISRGYSAPTRQLDGELSVHQTPTTLQGNKADRPPLSPPRSVRVCMRDVCACLVCHLRTSEIVKSVKSQLHVVGDTLLLPAVYFGYYHKEKAGENQRLVAFRFIEETQSSIRAVRARLRILLSHDSVQEPVFTFDSDKLWAAHF